jgi:hypothetical protein
MLVAVGSCTGLSRASGCGPEGCGFGVLPRVLEPTRLRVSFSLSRVGKRHALLAGRCTPRLAPLLWGYHFSRFLAGGISDTYTHLSPTALKDGLLPASSCEWPTCSRIDLPAGHRSILAWSRAFGPKGICAFAAESIADVCLPYSCHHRFQWLGARR